eukprot:scaffold1077_cov191-Alexandrium_tamarense.AAC.43
MPLLDITNLPRKTASVVIATDKENIIPSPTQQPTNLSNDNDLADYLKGICWDDDTLTWQCQYNNGVKMMLCHHAISSMTDGVFSAEGMLVPAVLVNGRPHCPLPPRLSKSASKEKQYYCEDVAGPYYQDDGSPYQG